MQRIVTGAIAFLGVCVLADAAESSAKAAPATAVPTFESLDRNADHRLSRSEAGFNRWVSDIFVAGDADGDGFITREEYARATSGAVLSGNLATR